jgi:NAD(P)-dependent dehydrogenase (short-subunit alcohol dehydrogenase family)
VLEESMKLTGRTAIVTGGAKGIGFGIARRFVAEGARVVIADVDADAGVRAAAMLEVAARAVSADVSRPADVTRLIDQTLASFGRLDILVNNAGVSHPAAFLDVSLDIWERTLAVNLTGAFLCGQAAARVMAQQRWGRIINIASINSFIAEPHAAHYAASKGALVQLTKGMAVDLAPYNVLVNAIAPGPIATERSTPIFTRPDQQTMLKRVLLGHPGTPNDVAAAAAFLASDDASFIQGTVLLVDGGFLAG